LKTEKTLIMIPTYNERDNVQWLFQGITAQNLGVDILFVDDNSPDGTGQILDTMALEHKELSVLHRRGKEGIGSAHKAGIRWAYEKGYTTLITMDADLTHSPNDIFKFLNSKNSDIVVGSRYLQVDSLKEWNFLRRVLTQTANFLTSHMLGLKEDATGGFRLYRLSKIPFQVFELVESNSYSFFFESLYLLKTNRFQISEVPISLPPRTYGSSKMQLSDALRSIKVLIVLFLKGLVRSKTLNANFDAKSTNGRS
jgi:dolichol-phosphate mannosyltransferase